MWSGVHSVDPLHQTQSQYALPDWRASTFPTDRQGHLRTKTSAVEQRCRRVDTQVRLRVELDAWWGLSCHDIQN
jgi:hypothetical protein